MLIRYLITTSIASLFILNPTPVLSSEFIGVTAAIKGVATRSLSPSGAPIGKLSSGTEIFLGDKINVRGWKAASDVY